MADESKQFDNFESYAGTGYGQPHRPLRQRFAKEHHILSERASAGAARGHLRAGVQLGKRVARRDVALAADCAPAHRRRAVQLGDARRRVPGALVQAV